MKITDVKTEKLSIELAEPFHVAFGTITHGDNWRVKVMTDEGIYGNGSAKCAFDIALYDIIGKEKNLPLYKSLPIMLLSL